MSTKTESADANREGFRVLRREPALFFMELLWRWSFGLGVLAVAMFAYSHLRQTVMLSDADELVFSSQDPIAFAETATNVVAQALPLLLKTLTQVSGFLAVLWIAAAALGRGIITRIVVRRFAADYGVAIAADAPRWTSFAILMFARVLMLLILVIGYLGGVFFAALINPTGQNLLVSALIVFASLVVSGVLWSYVNWVLSLAPIFVACDALSTLDSIVAAIAFVRRNYSRVTAIALWNSTVRSVMAAVISIAGVFSVMLRLQLSPAAVVVLLGLETLAYLVVSDFLLLARFAAYASVALRERSLSPVVSGPADRPGTAVC